VFISKTVNSHFAAAFARRFKQLRFYKVFRALGLSNHSSYKGFETKGSEQESREKGMFATRFNNLGVLPGFRSLGKKKTLNVHFAFPLTNHLEILCWVHFLSPVFKLVFKFLLQLLSKFLLKALCFKSLFKVPSILVSVTLVILLFWIILTIILVLFALSEFGGASPTGRSYSFRPCVRRAKLRVPAGRCCLRKVEKCRVASRRVARAIPLAVPKPLPCFALAC